MKLADRLRRLERQVDDLGVPTAAEYEAALARCRWSDEDNEKLKAWYTARAMARLEGQSLPDDPQPVIHDQRTEEEIAADHSIIQRRLQAVDPHPQYGADEFTAEFDALRERLKKRLEMVGLTVPAHMHHEWKGLTDDN